MGGVQRTSDFLEKSTWYLVVALFVSCMFAGIYNGNRDANVGIDESFLPSTTAPAAPVSPAAVDAPPSTPAATEEVAE